MVPLWLYLNLFAGLRYVDCLIIKIRERLDEKYHEYMNAYNKTVKMRTEKIRINEEIKIIIKKTAFICRKKRTKVDG